LSDIGGSALTDKSINIPDYKKSSDIPVTYVPARNTIFLSLALAWSEVIGSNDIFIGVNSVDYSGYPDCRPEYIEAFEKMANLATKNAVMGKKVTIHTPLIYLNKAEIIGEGLKLGVDYSNTITCYRANDLGEACGKCDACELRKIGFKNAGFVDPTKYV
jgi:7-cyano-7-deazaguanine synthase